MAVQRRVYEADRIANEPGLEHRASTHGEIYFETTHAGLVVEKESQYLGDGESAYYAVVFVPDSGAFDKVWYASDRDTYFGQVEVDAPPAIQAAWSADKARRQAEAEQRRELHRLDLARQAAELYARTPRVGSAVRVVKGRKIKIDSEGRVFWVGDSEFGPRAGLELSDGTREFTAMSNLEVLEQPI